MINRPLLPKRKTPDEPDWEDDEEDIPYERLKI